MAAAAAAATSFAKNPTSKPDLPSHPYNSSLMIGTSVGRAAGRCKYSTTPATSISIRCAASSTPKANSLLDSLSHSPRDLSTQPSAFPLAAAAVDTTPITTQAQRRHARRHASQEKPNWNLLQRWASAALDTVEDVLIHNMLERQRPLPRTADPAVQIAGNFAPVDEQPVRTNLPVAGRIPPFINGVYVRNGANPQFEPVAGHHLFDGDGMVHAVTLRNGAASYACRYTETQRLVQERAIGKNGGEKKVA